MCNQNPINPKYHQGLICQMLSGISQGRQKAVASGVFLKEAKIV